MTIDHDKPVTAITLVDCFEECCPRGVWYERDMRPTRSTLYQLARLKSLFRAFEIPFDPTGFEWGYFILRKERRELYSAMIARLTSQLPERPTQPPDIKDLQRMFPVLRVYRRNIEAARRSYRTQKSPPPFARLVLEEAIIPASERISLAISQVSGLLAELIAPDGRRFRLEDLIRDHGHPTEDYRELRREEEEESWRALLREVDGDETET